VRGERQRQTNRSKVKEGQPITENERGKREGEREREVVVKAR